MRRLRRAAAASFLALAACNEIVGFSELERDTERRGGSSSGGGGGGGGGGGEQPLDAGGDGGAPSTPDGGPRCDPDKAFTPPEIIAELDATADTRSAIMSVDELEIFYLRGITAPYELRHARRARATDPWSPPVTETLTESAALLGSLTAGALKLYFYQPIVGTEPTKIFFATRPRREEPFGAASRVNGTIVNDRHFITPADDVAYASRGLQGDGGVLESELLQASVFANAVGAPKRVPGIHAVGARDSRPVVNDAETILLFASARPGGPGALDIWMATRTSKTVAFSPPSRVDELSSASAEQPTWISSDGCVVLLDRGSHFLTARRPR